MPASVLQGKNFSSLNFEIFTTEYFNPPPTPHLRQTPFLYATTRQRLIFRIFLNVIYSIRVLRPSPKFYDIKPTPLSEVSFYFHFLWGRG